MSDGFDFGQVPRELKALRQWVPWGDKKVPLIPVNRPGSFLSFEEALKRNNRRIGFVFTAADPYVGIDLDHCIDPQTDDLTPEAMAIVEAIDSYSEESVSRKGLHIICRGRIARALKKSGLEVYAEKRFFIVTGWHYPGTPLECHERQHELDLLIKANGARNGTQTGADIAPGERNITLTSLAGKMRKAGLDKEEITAALREINQRRCKPPLDNVEVAAIASSVAGYKTGQQEPQIVKLRRILETGLWARDIFRYDAFTHTNEIQDPSGKWGPITDEHYHQILHYSGDRHRASFPRELTIHAVSYLCRSNTYDSLKDYLNAAKWDGTPRLEHFLSDAFGCPQTEYHALVGGKFIQSLVARGLTPGCKMDYCPIFYSRQGAEKSKILRALGGQWFTDVLPSKLTGRDIVYALQGVWLIEACELEAFTRADTEVLKAFISRQVDRTDLKYRTTSEEFHRRCVVAGTTNTRQMLKDSTGGRRFWPVECGTINVDYVTDNRDQLFAEAAHNHGRGVPWWPDQKHAEMLEVVQEEHYLADSREEDVREFVDGQSGGITTAGILNYLGVKKADQNRRIQMDIAGIMARLEYVNRPMRVAGRLTRVWLKS